MDLVPQLGTETFYDEESASKYLVASLSQWVSYEDAESFADKSNFLMSRCLRGFAVWSLDLDTQDYQALTALVGEDAMVHGFVEDQLNPDERRRLVDDLAAYTGQNCYVTMSCTDGSSDSGTGRCQTGYMSVATGHYPNQISPALPLVSCPEGQWHHVCCPSTALPRNCEWRGAPEQSEFGCNPGCGETVSR
jgi:chitinase